MLKVKLTGTSALCNTGIGPVLYVKLAKLAWYALFYKLNLQGSMLYVKLEWGQCCMLNWNGTNAVSELCIGPMLYVNLAYDRFCM